MYHNVFLEKTEGIICKDEFEKHMSYVKDKKSFKMEEVEKLNFRLPENSMLVTFDDGYKNTYTVAYPILKKYNIKATIFLNTKYINNDDAYLTWDEIREMYNSGLVDFQMHTHSHCPVIRKLQVKGFFDENVNEFVRRESLSIYKNGLIGKEREKEIYFKDFDFEGSKKIALENIQAILADKPADMTITTHVCRGNYKSSYLLSGAYDPVAPELFGQTAYDGYFLEYDTDRAGGFEPLKYFNDNPHKGRIVLGLITSKFPELEDKAAVKARIAEAAKIVPLEQLALSPQCGFASTEEGNIMTEAQQWAKVKLVEEIAAEVWGED